MKYLIIIFLLFSVAASAQKKVVKTPIRRTAIAPIKRKANGVPDTIYTVIGEARQVTKAVVDSLNKKHVFQVIENAQDSTKNQGASAANKVKEVRSQPGKTIINPFQSQGKGFKKDANTVEIITFINFAPGVGLALTDSTYTVVRK
jgi:hypothetical protein